MSASVYAHIRNNPLFADLVKRRGRFAWLLAAVVFIVFYGFVMAVAFAPDLIASRPFAGSHLTVGILAGLFQFVVFWILTFFYVRRANGEFDTINKEIIKQAWEAEK